MTPATELFDGYKARIDKIKKWEDEIGQIYKDQITTLNKRLALTEVILLFVLIIAGLGIATAYVEYKQLERAEGQTAPWVVVQPNEGAK